MIKLIRKEKSIIIVESIGDMLALWDCGITNVVVAFGLSLSSALMGVFIKLDFSQIIISFNDDSQNSNAGNKAAEKAEQKLLNYFDPHQIKVILPTLGDFGEMSRDQILTWVEKING